MSSLEDDIPESAMITARIEIIRFLTEDSDVLVWCGVDGSDEDLALVETLGMLRLTEDTAIRELMGAPEADEPEA